MMVLEFNKFTKQQVKKVIDFARLNIYQIDDLLDMMNNQMAVPGEQSEHLVLVPVGRWICYYLVDHPHLGRCHYFSIKTDASGKQPSLLEMEYFLKEFGINQTLLNDQITIDKVADQTNIILPIDS